MADYDKDKLTSHYADESFSKHYNPGMIEAKIMMPYKTSTPMKPIFFKSDDSSFAETGVEDSGYLSTLTENTSARKSDSSDCKDGCKNLSLFESMLQSRNHSINLEQLVEKVNLRKEKKNEMLYNVSTAGRPRSYSASEVSSVISGPRRVRVSEDSSNSSLSSWSNVSSSSLLSESGSPTLDQVLLMGRADKLRRFPRVGISPQLSRSSSDYDISDMLAAIKMKEGPLQSPQTSPDASSYIRNPESLFGLETLQRCLYQPRKESCKPGLASISEAECDGSLSTTPREYYSSGLSPGMTTFPLTPQLDSPEQVLVCQSSSVTWSGNIPQRQHQHPRYSAKIFLGGVPWDVTEISLVQAFSQFGQIRIEWPGKDSSPSPPKGYVYIVFDDEEHVPHLLAQCSHSNTAWYFKISSRRMRSKEVQIIPWVLADSNYVRCPSQRLDPQKTVFVGALHGMLNAEGLAHIFNDLFGGVVYAGIDTDKHKYPIGSGRVTFSSSRSYMKAVAASFVEIKCPQFNKRVQVDPYLEDALCSSCLLKQGPYFCRDLNCFKYFCRHCWEAAHGGEWRHHKPLMRNTRTGGGPATRPTISLTPPRV